MSWLRLSPILLGLLISQTVTTTGHATECVYYEGHFPDPAPLAGSLATPGFASKIVVMGDLAFLACGPDGLQVIDITDSSTPVLLGWVDTPGTAQAVAVLDGAEYACVADGESGLQIVDITQPADPQIVGSYDTPGEARGLALIGSP